jgi:tRNA 2-thiouridine synthesizing protein A
MPSLLDVRGLRCPLPLVRARAELPAVAAGDALEVLATDPEAPIDLAALAADEGLELTVREEPGGGWRLTLRRPALRSAAPGPPGD